MPLQRPADYDDNAALDFPSFFRDTVSSQEITAPMLTQDQLINQRREEADAREIEMADKLIDRLPDIMKANGYPVGASFMSRWLQGDGTVSPHTEPEVQQVSWDFLHKFKRVNDGLTDIHRTVTKLQGRYIPKDGFFSATQPAAKSYDKLQSFLKTSKKQIQADGASDEYRYYIGSQVVSYVSAGDLIIDDDLSVSMGRFPLKTHLLGRLGKFDTSKKAYPFMFSSYEVSVADNYDFGNKGDPFWKNQLLGKWGSKGMLDPDGVLLWNSSFRDYAERQGRGRDFDVRSDSPLLKQLDTPSTIYLAPGY